MKNVIIVLLVLTTAIGGFMYWREHRLVLQYEKQQQSRDALKEALKDKTAAIFDRVDGLRIYFRTPVETKTPQGTFINYKDQVGTLATSAKVFVAGSGTTDISAITPNSPITLDLAPDPQNPGQFIVYDIYITE